MKVYKLEMGGHYTGVAASKKVLLLSISISYTKKTCIELRSYQKRQIGKQSMPPFYLPNIHLAIYISLMVLYQTYVQQLENSRLKLTQLDWLSLVILWSHFQQLLAILWSICIYVLFFLD
ncbi:unnamed protein product [Cuscuta epithymum]|uniref:Uncharacterized protein n=1 Tax=Cuscuta epithymum TaxID=186058 RepID=A0AAV0GF90_9ASTE|nr:unnamed protein product [Cuscuta epithymum]